MGLPLDNQDTFQQLNDEIGADIKRMLAAGHSQNDVTVALLGWAKTLLMSSPLGYGKARESASRYMLT